MRIADNFLKCVCFVGFRMADGSFRMAGSATFYSTSLPYELGAKRNVMYVVTARHVIEGIRGTGCADVWLRVNVKDGGSEWVSTSISQWIFHPTDATIDVAILFTQFDPRFDHCMLAGWGLKEEELKAKGVSIGDPVFITGMFRHHHGQRRNVPIARHGNIACLNEERVGTRLGEMDAYLIEVRSIGGLSGSPVFGYVGKVKNHEGVEVDEIRLLGLIHGHFDAAADTMDSIVEDKVGFAGSVNVNTGIAIVVPYSRIHEVTEFHKNTGDLNDITPMIRSDQVLNV